MIRVSQNCLRKQLSLGICKGLSVDLCNSVWSSGADNSSNILSAPRWVPRASFEVDTSLEMSFRNAENEDLCTCRFASKLAIAKFVFAPTLDSVKVFLLVDIPEISVVLIGSNIAHETHRLASI